MYPAPAPVFIGKWTELNSRMSRVERTSKLNMQIDNDLQKQVMLLVDKYGQDSLYDLVEDPHIDFKYALSDNIINHEFIDYAKILSRISTLPLEVIINIRGDLLEDKLWSNIFAKNQNLTNEFLIKLNNEYGISLCKHITILMTRGFLVNPADFFKLKKYGSDVNAYYYAQFLLQDKSFAEMFEIYTSTANGLLLTITTPDNEEERSLIVCGIRDIICQRPDFDFTYLDKYGDERRNNCFAWHHLSKNPNLTLDIVIKHKNRPWIWGYISNNPAVISKDSRKSLEFITSNPQFTWRWDCLSQHIHPELIKEYRCLSWNLHNLNINKALTPTFVLENLMAPWGFHELLSRFYMHPIYVDFYKTLHYSYARFLVPAMTIESLFKQDAVPADLPPMAIIQYLKHNYIIQEYRKHLAAYRIQQHWHRINSDPKHPVCQRRLERDYEQFKVLAMVE